MLTTQQTARLDKNFTFAPTAPIVAKPAQSMTRKIDQIQANFNMALFNLADRTALVPVSDALYDLFCAYEANKPEAYEMAEALIASMKAHPCRDTAGMMDAIAALEDAVEGEMIF